jgi:hypothetical protein
MSSVQMKKKQKGQGMVEYITVVALIGLGALAAFSFFGKSVRGQVAQMSSQVAGSDETTGQTNSAGAATGAITESGANIGLDDYNAHPKSK